MSRAVLVAWSPFTMSGPDFLELYVGLLVVAVIAAVAAWFFARLPADAPPGPLPQFTPLEVAFLAGGEQTVADAAIAGLLHEGIIQNGTALRSFSRSAVPLGKRRTAVERAVADAAQGSASIEALRSAGRAVAREQGARLERAALVLSAEGRAIVCAIMVTPLATVFLLGALRLVNGILNQRPVGFLFVLLVAAAFAIVAAWRGSPLRTFRGDHALERLRAENAALHATASATDDKALLGGRDLALAFALFGTAVLHGAVLTQLAIALQPPVSTGSSGSSCSSCGSSCGGGCGGGCGGCGG